jgi:anti-anti-sigma factor
MKTELGLDLRSVSDRGVVVAARGRLDAAGAPALRALLQRLAAEGRVEMVVDLSGVEALDGSGLSALVSGLKAARERGGFLRVAGLADGVASTFRRTALDRVFDLFPSVEAAFA